MRNNRGGPKNLVSLKKETEGGTSMHFQKKHSQLLIWNDKKPEVMLTSKYNVDQVIEVKNKILPNVIHKYNTYMGGVDKFDQLIKYYTMKRKTNRWTQRFTTHIFEILLHNSYVLYKLSQNDSKKTHYDFVEIIISFLLTKANIVLPDDANYNSDKHHLPVIQLTRSNCKLCYGNEKRLTTCFKCEACNIYLCIKSCFYEYHVPSFVNNNIEEEELSTESTN